MVTIIMCAIIQYSNIQLLELSLMNLSRCSFDGASSSGKKRTLIILPHIHESKYFFAFARYDPSLFNLIRRLWTIQKGIGNSGGNFSYDCVISHANNCKNINRGINPIGHSTLNSIWTIWVHSTSIFCEFWSSAIYKTWLLKYMWVGFLRP